MNKNFSYKVKVALGALALVSLAGTAFATHSWGIYHWARTSNPFTLKLVDSVTSGWNSYLETTSSDWSGSTVLDTAIVAGNDSSTTRKKCQAVLGQNRICNATYGNNGWLGVAQIWIYSDGHIAQGTVKLNDTYFNTSKYNTTAWRNLVMCQEVGHTFGLNHQDENFANAPLGTCMDYSSDPTPNQHPNEHDYAQLEAIYAHPDSFTTIKAVSSGTNKRQDAREKDNDVEFGKPMKHDSKGRTSVFENDLGNGKKVFTFVFWAE